MPDPISIDEAVAEMRAAGVSEEEVADFLDNGVKNLEFSDTSSGLPLFVTLRRGRWIYAVTQREDKAVKILHWTVEGFADNRFAKLADAVARANSLPSARDGLI